MNPPDQQPATQPPEPTPQIQITSSQISGIGRTFGSIFLTGLLLFSLLPLLLGGVFAASLFDRSNIATAPATITHIAQSSSRDSDTGQINITCTLTYQFVVAGRDYTGASSVGSDTNCGRSVGTTITAHYNPSDPSHNTIDGKESGIIGAIFFVIGLVIFLIAITGLLRLRAGNKNQRAATNAQLELIANGFQELGDYWEPRHMTQAEAEQMIADINKRIAAQRRQTPS